MYHPDHDIFLTAIDRFETLAVAFTSRDLPGAELRRTCAPLDYGPRAQAADRSPCYHLWDYDPDSPEDPHAFALLTVQVLAFERTGETFDPAEFVTWAPHWHHPRDWGAYS